MKYFDYSNIKFSHIRIFLAVAEYESFTVASEKLHLTQPFVSKVIAGLEKELDLYLFIRKNRSIQITPAGRKLYQEWSALMSNFETAISNAQMTQSGRTEKLTIGIGELGRVNGFDPLLNQINNLKTHFPNLEVYVEYDNLVRLTERLIRSEFDLIIVSDHVLPAIRDLNIEWCTLIEAQLAIFINRDNPLSERESLDFCDLKREQFVVFSSDRDNNYMNLLQDLARDAGFQPQISFYVQHEASFQANLELNNGIVLANSISNLDNERIKRFDLPRRCDLIAMWKPESMRESIQSFLNGFRTE